MPQQSPWTGSCLKTGQHFIFAIINLLLPIKCIIFDSVSKILFIFLLPIIMILIMKIFLHNVYKIINLRYPTYVYPFLIFLIIKKIECWPVFKQDPMDYNVPVVFKNVYFFCLASQIIYQATRLHIFFRQHHSIRKRSLYVQLQRQSVTKQAYLELKLNMCWESYHYYCRYAL